MQHSILDVSLARSADVTLAELARLQVMPAERRQTARRRPARRLSSAIRRWSRRHLPARFIPSQWTHAA